MRNMPKTALAQAISSHTCRQTDLFTGCELSQLRHQLDSAGWNARAFESCYPDLIRYARQLQASERMNWLQGLRQLWINQGWGLKRVTRESLLALACEWQDWPLVDSICAQLEEANILPDAGLLYWAEALFQLGSDQACVPLQYYLQAYPQCEQGAELYALISAQENWLEEQGLQQIPQDEMLLLMPMQHHHREPFMWQYHDPEIAELCCLPTFNEVDLWHQWLDECYSYGDQQTLAIIHRDWGMVGQIALTIHEGVGFVYYWIGSDFRGQNLAPQAVSMLLSHAHQYWGLECCYAKLFDFNNASRRVLEKIGFVNLGISAQAPDEQEVFYRLGEEQSYQDSVQELHQLLIRMKSDTRISSLLVV